MVAANDFFCKLAARKDMKGLNSDTATSWDTTDLARNSWDQGNRSTKPPVMFVVWVSNDNRHVHWALVRPFGSMLVLYSYMSFYPGQQTYQSFAFSTKYPGLKSQACIHPPVAGYSSQTMFWKKTRSGIQVRRYCPARYPSTTPQSAGVLSRATNRTKSRKSRAPSGLLRLLRDFSRPDS